MATGAPPNNISFNSSRNIMPSLSVKTALYNANGYVAHPLEHFGRGGGVVGTPVAPPAGHGPQPGEGIGGGPHFIGHITGRQNGNQY